MKIALAALVVASGSPVLAQALPDYVDLLPLPVPTDAWVWAGSPPGDGTRLFVMEGGGTIRLLDIAYDASGKPAYTLRPTVFLAAPTSQARSVAFAPDFHTSGKFYVAAVAGSGLTSVTEYSLSTTPPFHADPATARTIIQLPASGDHAVGSIHFGADGLLYIGLGDAFRSDNSQNLTVLPGKMLRLDLSGDDFPQDPLSNYRIPAANPLRQNPAARHEILHIGVRNPWRWSFDRWNGDMWIFDVGGSQAGEISRWPAGGPPYQNFGWPHRDGNLASGGMLHPDFTPDQLVPPALAFSGIGSQCSTSGGVMYRGNEIRPWRGRVVWTDYCANEVYSAPWDGFVLGPVQEHRLQLTHAVSGAPVFLGSASMIAEDGRGELYFLQANRGTSSGGLIYRFVAAGPQPFLADLGTTGGTLGGDGVLDNNDFVVFIDLFFANDPRADLGITGGGQGVDQRLDNNDFVAFIDAFFSGT